MARITKTLVVQGVDDERAVIIDDSAGTEIVITYEDAVRLCAAVSYLADSHHANYLLERAISFNKASLPSAALQPKGGTHNHPVQEGIGL